MWLWARLLGGPDFPSSVPCGKMSCPVLLLLVSAVGVNVAAVVRALFYIVHHTRKPQSSDVWAINV
jgi:hypothetical protein